jgi:hypothetical protein
MIIVSQGKDELVNFDRIESIWIDVEEGRVTIEATADTNSTLGTYSTEERAKEVLQGIINAYEKAGNIAFETSEDERLMRLTHNSNVFEMPEK